MTAPDDTVRVSRKLAQRILDRIECETGDPVAVCADLRAALSTPPVSPDAGRVERCDKCVYHHSTDGVNISCRRFAPTGSTIAKDRVERGSPWLAIWPYVNEYDWCGDFKALDAALATPSAPEDAKGEGVNEFVHQLVALYRKIICAQGYNSGFDHAISDAIVALRAAAGNTERK